MGYPLQVSGSANGIVKSSGKLYGISSTNSGAAIGSVIVYDNLSAQSGTVVMYAAATAAVAGAPIQASFPDGIEFQKGLSVTLSGATTPVVLDIG